VTVAFSGTGGGFKKFCAGETDANNASRPIKTGAESEDELCTTNGVEYIELKVALDALAVVVNPENDFVDCLSVAELNAIWGPDSTVMTWADVRAGWPAEEIELYGPGADSGTFDYFTEEINGEAKASRSDYTASEDDNTLVQGISGSKYALGYFGLAYVTENVGKVKAVPVDGGAGCTMPSADAANDGTYSPLGRPLFVYPSVAALARPEVAAFFRFYLENTNELSEAVGYIGLNDADLSAAKATLEAALK
jgi:phosphate transport system substrate-binding protein